MRREIACFSCPPKAEVMRDVSLLRFSSSNAYYYKKLFYFLLEFISCFIIIRIIRKHVSSERSRGIALDMYQR